MTTPTAPGLFIFRGCRHSHPGSVELITAPVQVIEVLRGREKELAVILLGRATRYALARFSGEWQPLVIEAKETQP